MDNRKLRYAKRKTKEKILSQRDRAYYRNLNFREKGKWYNRKIEPKPGMIMFFDWDNDGVSEHTGIVEKYEDGLIYTIEGNSHDVCRRKWYEVADKCIMGYGGAIKTKPNNL